MPAYDTNLAAEFADDEQVGQQLRLLDRRVAVHARCARARGKIRYVGCSNFSGWHLMKSLVVSDRYGYRDRAMGSLACRAQRARVWADAVRSSSTHGAAANGLTRDGDSTARV
jgi:hypothetical protein